MCAKSCTNCGCKFQVYERDLGFLHKMSPVFDRAPLGIPEPRLCPACRRQRRLAHRNQGKLYRRTCDLSGNDLISLYSADKPYTVYSEDLWWKDSWSPLEYGRDYDLSRSFFEQFSQLLLAVPRKSMQQDGSNENCEYTTYGMSNKACYLSFACLLCEEVYYSSWLVNSRRCFDCMLCTESELLYACVDCTRCYSSAYLKDCTQCRDSFLLRDCQNCSNCICCKNLVNKDYHIYNKRVAKAEYQDFLKSLHDSLDIEKEHFSSWEKDLPSRPDHILSSDDSRGDYLQHARSCFDCFDIIKGAENCSYCWLVGWNAKDIFDACMAGVESELLYEVHATAHSYNCAFCSFCHFLHDCYYCESTQASHHCFGCVGLNHQEFCILNKQYTEKDYNALLPKIISNMKKGKEWGEFFPVEISPFCYNETLAQEYFPLSKETVEKRGLRWKDDEGQPTRKASFVPAGSILDIPDSVVKEVLSCCSCKANYRVIKQELEFYRELSLPLPKYCPSCRHLDRIALRNTVTFRGMSCSECGTTVETSLLPERNPTIYCDSCYSKEYIY